MADRAHDNDPALARALLIELLDADGEGWKLTRRALEEGRRALHWMRNRTPSEFEIVEFIRQRLADGFPIERVGLGQPPGSAGVGWVMKNPDGRDTYVKLKVEEDGIRDVAVVLSCHTTIHPKK